MDRPERVDMPLVLALGAGPVGAAGSRSEPVMTRQVQKALVKDYPPTVAVI